MAARNPYSSVGKGTRLGAEEMRINGLSPGRDKTSSSPKLPHWLWGPPSLLCNGYRETFSGRGGGGGREAPGAKT